jgi:hypothetical protein
MADNVAITAGAGTTIATDEVGGAQYQRVKSTFGPDGTATDVQDLHPMPVATWPRGLPYCYSIPSQVHVAEANKIHWDLWNNDSAKKVRVLSIRQIPNIVTAVTGVVFEWKLSRSTAIGTGGAAQTAWLPDVADEALDADITCRSKPTGGAGEGTILTTYALSSEETNAATIQIASQGGLELLPAPLVMGKGIVLGKETGLRVTQITNSAAGNTGWLISFTVE